MTALMKRIFRRRPADESPRAGVASMFRGPARGDRLPGYKRLPSFGRAGLRGRVPWSTPAPPPVAPADPAQPTEPIVAGTAPAPSFKDRSSLRRRLRFLRRARELGFRDVGGLIFDMRRFGRNRPDLLDSKLDALLAVDQELRALERVLGDRRPIHELREPGIAACARCGALHSSEANFCPQCGLQISGPRAMGELGGAIAAPPKAPQMPAQQEWSWPIPAPVDQPTEPTVMQRGPQPEPVAPADQPTISFVPELSLDEPVPAAPATGDEAPAEDEARADASSADEPRADAPAADEPHRDAPAEDEPHDEPAPGEEPTEVRPPRRAPGGS